MKRLLLCAVAAISLVSGSLLAAPVAQIKSGMTTIILDPELVMLLESCSVARIKPAVLDPQGVRWRFKVSGGVIDQANNAGELDHNGGVTISCGEEPGQKVSIQNLRLDNTDETPVLTAILVVDDGPLQRRILFTPGGEIDGSLSNGGVIRLSGVQLTFADQQVVDLFNTLLGTGGSLTLDSSLGRANSRIKVLPSGSRGEVKVNGNGNGNNKNKVKDEVDDDKSEGEGST